MGMEEQLTGSLGEIVDAGGLAGAVAVIWRGGQQLQASVGWLDREAGRPMQPDALFRIASMTKPITSLVALQLWEEGRFALDDAVERWAPELATPRVLRSLDALGDTVPAHRPITFLDLLTHRAGLTYGGFHPGPLGRAHTAALGADIDSALEPDDWIAGLGTLPLIDQPGHTLHYGHSTDLLGLLLARITGVSLGQLLHERVFRPLGMDDTGFVVPPDRRDRRAVAYGFDADGALEPRAVAPGGATLAERPEEMRYESGGQGLWSTAGDYLRFARVFLEGGTVEGVRLLEASTLERMCTNVLSPSQRASAEVGGMHLFARGHGFGLGVAVVLEPEQAAVTLCSGSRGTIGWPGAYGGWWQADPQEGSAAVFLTHNMVERDQLEAGVGLEVYEAIGLVHALSRAGQPGPGGSG